MINILSIKADGEENNFLEKRRRRRRKECKRLKNNFFYVAIKINKIGRISQVEISSLIFRDGSGFMFVNFESIKNVLENPRMEI